MTARHGGNTIVCPAAARPAPVALTASTFPTRNKALGAVRGTVRANNPMRGPCVHMLSRSHRSCAGPRTHRLPSPARRAAAGIRGGSHCTSQKPVPVGPLSEARLASSPCRWSRGDLRRLCRHHRLGRSRTQRGNRGGGREAAFGNGAPTRTRPSHPSRPGWSGDHCSDYVPMRSRSRDNRRDRRHEDFVGRRNLRNRRPWGRTSARLE